jgi:hypothetical protein
LVSRQFIAKPDEFLAQEIMGNIGMAFRKRERLDRSVLVPSFLVLVGDSQNTTP